VLHPRELRLQVVQLLLPGGAQVAVERCDVVKLLRGHILEGMGGACHDDDSRPLRVRSGDPGGEHGAKTVADHEHSRGVNAFRLPQQGDGGECIVSGLFLDGEAILVCGDLGAVDLGAFLVAQHGDAAFATACAALFWPHLAPREAREAGVLPAIEARGAGVLPADGPAA